MFIYKTHKINLFQVKKKTERGWTGWTRRNKYCLCSEMMHTVYFLVFGDI